MKEKFHEIIYDCIAIGQVSSDRIALYLKDEKFYTYLRTQKTKEEVVYGQSEQTQLNA